MPLPDFDTLAPVKDAPDFESLKPVGAEEKPPVVRQTAPGAVAPTNLVPAIRLMGGELALGQEGDTHNDIIQREDLRPEQIDQRGFSDLDGKQFFDRETAAKGTQLPTEFEPGRLHSTDLPSIKTESWQEPGADIGPWRGGEVGRQQGMEEAAQVMQAIPAALAKPAELLGKAAVKGANIPTYIANYLNQGKAGYPLATLEDLPRPQVPKIPGTDVVTGAANAAINLINQMVPPFAPAETGLTLPVMGAGGKVGKGIAGVYGAAAGASVPQATGQAVETLFDPKATAAEKTEAVANPVVQTVLAGLMLRTAGATPKPEFQGPLATGEVLKTPEGAKPPPQTEIMIKGEGEPTPEPATEPKRTPVSPERARIETKIEEGEAILSELEKPPTAEQAIQSSLAPSTLPTKGTEPVLSNRALDRLRKRVEQSKQEGILSQEPASEPKPPPSEPGEAQPSAVAPAAPAVVSAEKAPAVTGVEPAIRQPITDAQKTQLKQLGLTDKDITDLQSGNATVSEVVARKLPGQPDRGPDHANALEEARIQAQADIEQVFKNQNYESISRRSEGQIGGMSKGTAAESPETIQGKPGVEPVGGRSGVGGVSVKKGLQPEQSELANPVSIILQQPDPSKAADAIERAGGVALSRKEQSVPVAIDIPEGLFAATISPSQKGASLATGYGVVKDPSKYLQWWVDNRGTEIPEALAKKYGITQKSKHPPTPPPAKPQEGVAKYRVVENKTAPGPRKFEIQVNESGKWGTIPGAYYETRDIAKTALKDIKQKLSKPAQPTPAAAKVESEVKKPTSPEAQAGEGLKPGEGAGPGAEAAGVIPETGTGGEKYGIAERVRAERAAAGQVEAVPPGQGINTPDSIARGRELLKQGADYEEVLSKFEKTKQFSADDMAVVRAHGENLAWAARRVEEKFGTESPEYAEARKALSDWDKHSKAMQTEWHKEGMAQQGETDIDTGSFTGLERAYERDKGKPFNPQQKKVAKRIATANAKAQQSHLQAEEMMAKEISRRPTMSEAERRAQKAVWLRDRLNASRIAKLDRENRVDEVQRQVDIKRIEQENEARISKAVTEVAKKNAMKKAAADKAAVDRKYEQRKQLRKIEAARLAKVQKAIDQRTREMAAKAAERERKLQGDPARRVWAAAQVYIDKASVENAHISFDDIRNKVATDLGMSVAQVTKWMGQDKRMKYLADDLWRKQQDARRLREQAKSWLRKQDVPSWENFIKGLPRFLFNVRVGFHGTVALGTHAPAVAFQPRFWNAYVRDFALMYKMAFGPTIYEREMSDLVRRKNWTTARRSGLINDPYQYEEYHIDPVAGSKVAQISPKVAEAFNQLTSMGNRGYSVLKILRQDMFDQMWSNLPKNKQIPEVAKGISDIVNHATGVVQAKFHPSAGAVLFAPKLEASRVMWLAGDPIRMGKIFANWKNASWGDRAFAIAEAKEKAWVFGTMASLLALNQGFLSATGSKQQINITDPFRSDFLKFKIDGMQVSYGNPLITLARLPVRLFVNVKNESKFNKIIYEDENVYTTLGEYARTQLSPFASLLTDLAIGRDWQRRPLPRAGFGMLEGKKNLPKRLREQGAKPYTWDEFWGMQSLPIPFQEAAREVFGKGMGMPKKDQDHWLKAWAIVTFMSGTGGRLSEDWSLKRMSTPSSSESQQ